MSLHFNHMNFNEAFTNWLTVMTTLPLVQIDREDDDSSQFIMWKIQKKMSWRPFSGTSLSLFFSSFFLYFYLALCPDAISFYVQRRDITLKKRILQERRMQELYQELPRATAESRTFIISLACFIRRQLIVDAFGAPRQVASHDDKRERAFSTLFSFLLSLPRPQPKLPTIVLDSFDCWF